MFKSRLHAVSPASLVICALLAVAGGVVVPRGADAATTNVVYLTSSASSDLSTAHALSTAQPSGRHLVNDNTDKQSGWLELRSGGTSPAPTLTAQPPAPSGDGYLLDGSMLAGDTVASGTWKLYVKLKGNGAITVVPVARFYRWSSADGFTLIGSATGTSTALTSTASRVTLSTSAGDVAFGTGDRLYVDLLADVVKPATATGDGVVHLDNDGIARVVFPSYTSTVGAPPPPPPSGGSSGGVWHPAPGTSWQWQITGTVDTSLNVQMYDIDLYDAQPAASSYTVPGFGTVDVPQGVNAGVIDTLHSQGKVVICYLDTGAWENYRPDQSLFPSSVIGNSTGWSGERWLDIRQQSWSLFEPLIAARLDLAARSHCDGVEPDQNNPWGNKPGFPISLADQKAWYLEVAQLAHARGLSVGQKNGIETTDADTIAAFDWDLNEECNMYSECSVLNGYIAAGKAVFQVEYADEGMTTSQFCPADNSANFDGLLKKLALGTYRVACR